MRLAALPGQCQAQLDGFKSRVLRGGEQSGPRHLYATQWRSAAEGLPADAAASLLMVGEQLRSTTGGSVGTELAASGWSAVATASAWGRGSDEVGVLSALEEALTLVQEQAARVGQPAVWLLTPSDTPAARSGTGVTQAGGWGLARSVRSEAQLPVRCIGGSVASAVARGGLIDEPEAVLLP